MEEPKELDLEWAQTSVEGDAGRRNKHLLVIALVTGIVMFAAGFAVRSALTLHPKVTTSSSSPSMIVRTSSNLSTSGDVSKGPSIVVDIHGDVRSPGVYHLSENARVEDAVKAAGGFVHKQDAKFVNLAASVDDGQEVVIPNAASQGQNSDGNTPGNSTFSKADEANSGDTKTGGANVQGASNSSSSSTLAHATIDLNSADLSSLETLPGIGPGRAQAIVDYRRQHGPFHKVQDLQQVHGIGPQIFSRVKPYLIIAAK